MRVKCPNCNRIFLAFKRGRKEWICPYCKFRISIDDYDMNRGIYFYGYKVSVKFDDSEYGRALADLFKKGKIKIGWNSLKKDITIELMR